MQSHGVTDLDGSNRPVTVQVSPCVLSWYSSRTTRGNRCDETWLEQNSAIFTYSTISTRLYFFIHLATPRGATKPFCTHHKGAYTLRACSDSASAAMVFPINATVCLSSAARRAASPPPAESRHRKSVIDTVLRLRAGVIFAKGGRGRCSGPASCCSSALSAALLAVAGSPCYHCKKAHSRTFARICNGNPFITSSSRCLFAIMYCPKLQLYCHCPKILFAALGCNGVTLGSIIP
jgi:hypothetical protein